MNTNGSTARWVGIIAGIIIVLGFTTLIAAQTGILKRVEVNETDVRRIDKNQAVIIYQLDEIDGKLDKLLAK